MTSKITHVDLDSISFANGASDVCSYFAPILARDSNKTVLRIVYMSNHLRGVAYDEICSVHQRSGIDELATHITRKAVSLGAAGIVMIEHHPPNPNCDIDHFDFDHFARACRNRSREQDFHFLERIIVTNKGWFVSSFQRYHDVGLTGAN